MRRIVPIGLSMLGALIAAPANSQAGQKPDAAHKHAAQAPQAAPGHSHKGLLRRGKDCVECQRAKLMAQGIFIPPPPAIPSGDVAVGEVCTTCQQGTIVSGPVIHESQVVDYAPDSEPAGHAVVGDLDHGSPTGGAQLVGAEPVPVGVVQTNYNSTPPAGAVGGRVDPLALGHAGMARPQGYGAAPGPIPAAPTPASVGASARPKVLGHLFGVTGIGRGAREARREREREAHAMTTYNTQQGPVKDLPASAVYGAK